MEEHITLQTTYRTGRNWKLSSWISEWEILPENLIALYDEMSGLVDEGRAVYVDRFDLSKVFEIILHSIPTKKMRIMSGRENSKALRSLL